MLRRFCLAYCWALLFLPRFALAQDAPVAEEDILKTPAKAAVSTPPAKVDVAPAAGDREIADRLERILKATTWFEEPQVTVDEGVVFLHGRTKLTEYHDWAGKLAAKTQDVVAVVNLLEVTERPLWDLSPAWIEMRRLGRNAIQSLPLLGLAVVILAITFFVAGGAGRMADYLVQQRMPSAILRQVAARAAMIPVWLIGVYFVLRVSGLTQMAVTVLGGTGLAGLVLGIAFQNIAENFLAGILISLQRPFQTNDMIEVAGYQGLVQRVTARGTVLITPEGNHIQIPNAVIYKNVIRNFSANPNVRLDFKLGIGFDSSISDVQDLVMRVLRQHPAVLKTPEPLVLAEDLGPTIISIRAYFWINGKENDGGKTKSALLRLVKKELRLAGVRLPDPARDVLFPGGLPARRHDGDFEPQRPRDAEESTKAGRAAEGHLHSDEEMMKDQAANSRRLEEGADLLKSAANGHRG